jgi:hypothetical protein
MMLKFAESKLWWTSFPFHLKGIQHQTSVNISFYALSSSVFKFNALLPVAVPFHSVGPKIANLRDTSRSFPSLLSSYKPEHGHHNLHLNQWLEQEIHFRLLLFICHTLSISRHFLNSLGLMKRFIHPKYRIMWLMVIWCLLFASLCLRIDKFDRFLSIWTNMIVKT